MTIRIECTTHALDRYRERVEAVATRETAAWAAVEGQGIDPGVAMAIMGRRHDSHADGDRFVVTPCRRAMLVITSTGRIATVVALSITASRLLGEASSPSPAPTPAPPPARDPDTAARFAKREEELDARLSQVNHLLGVLSNQVDTLTRLRKGAKAQAVAMQNAAKKCADRRREFDTRQQELSEATMAIARYIADDRAALEMFADAVPWLRKWSGWAEIMEGAR